jgi:hypothetical protein
VDFFTVPTVLFQVLYVWIVLRHERRRDESVMYLFGRLPPCTRASTTHSIPVFSNRSSLSLSLQNLR